MFIFVASNAHYLWKLERESHSNSMSMSHRSHTKRRKRAGAPIDSWWRALKDINYLWWAISRKCIRLHSNYWRCDVDVSLLSLRFHKRRVCLWRLLWIGDRIYSEVGSNIISVALSPVLCSIIGILLPNNNFSRLYISTVRNCYGRYEDGHRLNILLGGERYFIAVMYSFSLPYSPHIILSFLLLVFILQKWNDHIITQYKASTHWSSLSGSTNKSKLCCRLLRPTVFALFVGSLPPHETFTIKSYTRHKSRRRDYIYTANILVGTSGNCERHKTWSCHWFEWEHLQWKLILFFLGWFSCGCGINVKLHQISMGVWCDSRVAKSS